MRPFIPGGPYFGKKKVFCFFYLQKKCFSSGCFVFVFVFVFAFVFVFVCLCLCLWLCFCVFVFSWRPDSAP